MQASDNILLNDPESLSYRRNSSTLVILGTGVIAFGFWGIIKLAAQVFLGVQIFYPEDLETLGEDGVLFATIIGFIVMFIDVILRLIAGFKAINEGRGKKAGKGYLVILMWLIAGSAFSVFSVFLELLNLRGDFESNFVSIFMELTSLVISLEVFIAGVSVKKYKKKRLGGIK